MFHFSRSFFSDHPKGLFEELPSKLSIAELGGEPPLLFILRNLDELHVSSNISGSEPPETLKFL